MREIWRPLKYHDMDLSNDFMVSNTGKIKSLRTNRILKTNFNKSTGREEVCVSLGSRGNLLCMKVHIAVASSFLDDYKDGLQVNHKDGNCRNNYVDNLEWVTFKENMNHGFDHKLMRLERIRVKCEDTGKIYESLHDAEKDTGDSRSAISRRLTGKIKRKQTKRGHFWSLLN